MDHEVVGCLGFFGYGSGLGPEDDHCTHCPARERCWQLHEEKTRQVVGAACELWDSALQESHGCAGIATLRYRALGKMAAQQFGYGKEMQQLVASDLFDPYTTGFLANVEVGDKVREGRPIGPYPEAVGMPGRLLQPPGRRN